MYFEFEVIEQNTCIAEYSFHTSVCLEFIFTLNYITKENLPYWKEKIISKSISFIILLFTCQKNKIKPSLGDLKHRSLYDLINFPDFEKYPSILRALLPVIKFNHFVFSLFITISKISLKTLFFAQWLPEKKKIQMHGDHKLCWPAFGSTSSFLSVIQTCIQVCDHMMSTTRGV